MSQDSRRTRQDPQQHQAEQAAEDRQESEFDLEPTDSVKAFQARLERNNLLSKEQQAGLADLSKNFPTPEALAARLVERNWLTSWQAQMLLAGHERFFLGKYKLLDRLGEGGMGAVFRAEQIPLGRIVALKMISKAIARDSAAVTRFRREIRAAAALDHPNIVHAYDADHVEDVHFLVMECVDGEDLQSLADRLGRLSTKAACELIRQAALGLHHAHERGMIHRDIKPRNLLVTKGTNGTVVKVLDFGLARVPSGGTKADSLTATGQIMGTPDYISPEQAQDSRTADERSDIYSLGLTLYRLLTGRLAFPGQNLMEKITARMNRDAPSVLDHCPELSPKLAEVVAKMTACRPEMRFQSAEEVAQALAPSAEAITLAELQPHKKSTSPTLVETVDFAVLEHDANTKAVTVKESQWALEELADKLRTEAVPQEGETQSLIQQQLNKRRQKDRRQFQWLLASVGSVIALVAGFFLWQAAGQTMIVIDWPAEHRNSGTVIVDGQEHPVDGTGRLEFPGDWGRRQLEIQREGYHPIKESWHLGRGEKIVFRPEWKPNEDTVRKLQIEALAKRIETTLSTNGATPETVAALQKEIADLQKEFRGTPEAETAQKLAWLLPSPFDELKREELSETVRSIIPDDVPIVGVYGDPRLRHWSRVHQIAWSPAGQYLAALDSYGELAVWDPQTDGRVWTLRSKKPRCFAFVPDGETIITGGTDSGYGLRFWNIETGQQTRFLPTAVGVHNLASSPDGSVLVAGGPNDSRLHLWELATDRYSTLPDAFGDGYAPFRKLVFSSDGSLLATAGGGDNKIRLWNIKKREQVAEFVVKQGHVLDIAMDERGKLLASVSGHHAQTGPELNLWKLTPENEAVQLEAPQDILGNFTSVSLSADGEILVAGTGSADQSGTIAIWNVETGEWLRTFDRQPDTRASGAVGSVELSPDGQTIASAEQAIVKFMDANTGQERFQRGIDGIGAVKKLAITPNSRHVLSASDGPTGAVCVRDVLTGEQLKYWGNPLLIQTLALSPDGQTLVTGQVKNTRSPTLVLRDLKTGEKQWLDGSQGHQSKVNILAFSPDGQRFASASSQETDTTIRIWDRKTGELLQKIEQDRPVGWLAFHPRKDRLISGHRPANDSPFTQFRFWSLFNGKKLHELTTREQELGTPALSPDGHWLFYRAEGGMLGRFDVKKRREMLLIMLPTDTPLKRLAHSPDGSLLAAALEDGSILVYRHPESNHRPIQKISPIGPAAPSDILFAPDGRHLLTANGNGTVYVLRLQEKDNEKTSTP